MNTYHKIKKPKYLVLRMRVFLVCLLLPLFANAGDYTTKYYTGDGTVLVGRIDNPKSSTNKPSDYVSPPRCGPRNCVAMCVTCFYDICRASGGTVEQCNLQKEYCKDSCYESKLEDCPSERPFCDFDDPYPYP